MVLFCILHGNSVKVGKFDERGRVVYHNDLEESLIVNASKVIDLIYQRYLKAKIGYEHDVRVGGKRYGHWEIND